MGVGHLLHTQVWDLGGQTSIRPYWRCYFPNTQAVIYVVDSSDTERIATSKQEFHAILEEEELKDAAVLVFANKQDLPGALSDAQVTEGLGLHKYVPPPRRITHHCQAGSRVALREGGAHALKRKSRSRERRLFPKLA